MERFNGADDITKAILDFTGSSNGRFFTSNGDYMKSSVKITDNGVSTSNLLAVHLLRILLIVLLYLYGAVVLRFAKLWEAISLFHSCLRLEQSENPGLINAILIPYKTTKRFYEIQFSSFSALNHSLAPRSLPQHVGAIIRVNKLPLSLNEDIRTKDLESHSEEIVHLEAEKIRLLNEMASFIFWNILLNIKSTVIHEETGLLWIDSITELNPVSEEIHPYWVQRIKDAIDIEMSTSSILVLPKRVRLIEMYTQSTFDIPINEVQGSSREEEIDTYTIYLSDSRILSYPFNNVEELESVWEIISKLPELLVEFGRPSSQFHTDKFISTLKMEPQTYIDGQEVFCYSTTHKHGFRSYMKALHYYSTNL